MSESFERDRELGAALLELEVPEHRVDFDRELRGLLALERRRRRRRRYLRWAVAPGLAAVAVVLVVLFGLPRTGSGPSSASAARMQAKVRTAFAEARALTGKLVFVVSPQGHPAQRSEQTFAIDSRGESGALTIRYKSLEQLDLVIERLRGEARARAAAD